MSISKVIFSLGLMLFINHLGFALDLKAKVPSELVSHSDYPKDVDGKVLIVDFWASWCAPCALSLPWYQTIQDRYPDKLKVIAINVDTGGIKESSKLLAKIEVDHLHQIYNPAGSLAKVFNVETMPSSYFFNPKGELVYIHKGFGKDDVKSLEDRLKSMLE